MREVFPFMSLGLDESKSKDVEREREVDAHYRALRTVWFAILASLVAMFVVTRIVTTEAGGPKLLFWMLLGLGVVDFGASFLLKQMLLRQAAGKLEKVRVAYIVALALCESIGLFGLVAYFVTNVEQYYFFFVLAGFGVLLHKPQRDDVLAAYMAGGGVWGARKND